VDARAADAHDREVVAGRDLRELERAVLHARAERALRVVPAAGATASAHREVRGHFGRAGQQHHCALDLLGLRAVGRFDDASDRRRRNGDRDIDRALRNEHDRLLVQRA